MIFYTTKFLKGFAGITYGPVILIHPDYKDDIGLLAHEKEHVKQWFRTLGLHSFLYLLSDRYKLWAEVQAYRVQLKHSPGNEERFARFIAEKYGLDITIAEALELLK
jgi:hypothetical protein